MNNHARHCEERSKACRERSVAEAIQKIKISGLLRFARNDGHVRMRYFIGFFTIIKN